MTLQRNSKTFLQILNSNKGIIYKVANAYCKNEENRKDLIQEIILQLWLAFPKYDKNYKLSTWMYRIALNVSISFYRKDSRRATISSAIPESMLTIELTDDKPAEDPRLELLAQFIRDLRSIDRAIMLLYLEEHSQQEIADLLGLTASNVSTKFARIKQRLKDKFSTYKNIER